MSSKDEILLPDVARYLGLDPLQDRRLLWIADEALHAPLPDPFEECTDEEGNLYYYDPISDESTWVHPLDAYYKSLVAYYKGNPQTLQPSPCLGNLVGTMSNIKDVAATVIQATYRMHQIYRLKPRTAVQPVLTERSTRVAPIPIPFRPKTSSLPSGRRPSETLSTFRAKSCKQLHSESKVIPTYQSMAPRQDQRYASVAEEAGGSKLEQVRKMYHMEIESVQKISLGYKLLQAVLLIQRFYRGFQVRDKLSRTGIRCRRVSICTPSSLEGKRKGNIGDVMQAALIAEKVGLGTYARKPAEIRGKYGSVREMLALYKGTHKGP
mmetsp:Transcript_45495/g.74130  ORF Transcript_45495/g.74130 Transcript_45495/m.74130 type:complete len:323 (+) Transcript_45495:65-1033(+)